MPALTCFFSRSMVVLGVTGLLAVTSPCAHAHGDDQVLIDALTEELGKAPEADLFIRRGELFRHHQEWAKAAADFDAAAKLEPRLAIIDFFRGRLWLEAGDPRKAEPCVERYVAGTPDEAEGWFLRGDIRAALGRHELGAQDYVEGLHKTPRPRPEHYLRRAKFLAMSPTPDAKQILAAIDEGIVRVGSVVSLVDYAIAVEIDRGNFAGALTRVDEAMQHTPRREAWLVRRGDILVKSGRAEEAIASYRAALSAIDRLPERYRETVPVEKLQRDARNALSRLSNK